MLSKDVCKQCREGGWGENDERDWDNLRQVECFATINPDSEPGGCMLYVSIDKPPPPNCPRKFEHAVAAGIVNIDKDKAHE